MILEQNRTNKREKLSTSGIMEKKWGDETLPDKHTGERQAEMQ